MADKRTALVTGASSGIGRELAELFAADGIDLVLAARNETRLQEVAEQLARERGIRVAVVASDLGDPDSAAILAANVDRLGPIDYLVNNAGVGSNGRFLDL